MIGVVIREYGGLRRFTQVSNVKGSINGWVLPACPQAHEGPVPQGRDRRALLGRTTDKAHYNEWAKLGKTDFKPVVVAYNELLDRFACGDCGGGSTSPPVNAESLRCACNAVNMNLKTKQK